MTRSSSQALSRASSEAASRDGDAAVAKARRTVLLVALGVMMLEVAVVLTTYGTNDVAHWSDFVAGEREAGPVGIYRLDFATSFYNHPPLIGYFLHLGAWLEDLGIPFRVTLRTTSCLADVATSLLVLELVRTRRGLRSATVAGLAVAASPALFLVAGFHGNTDPVFVCLALAALWLLADRDLPGWAGAAVALAVGVKIVPIVVLPCLLVFAWRRGPATLVRFVGAMAAVGALTWCPAIVGAFGQLRSHVLGYAGVGDSQWGLMEVGHHLGDPWWVDFLSGPGRGLIVAVCALVPAVMVHRRPDRVAEAVAWSLVGFLALAVADGTQYLVWPVAACYLVDLVWASVYNLLAGAVLFEVYDRWSGGLPWWRARADGFDRVEQIALGVLWVVLLVVWAKATAAALRGPWSRRPPPTHAGPAAGERRLASGRTAA